MGCLPLSVITVKNSERSGPDPRRRSGPCSMWVPFPRDGRGFAGFSSSTRHNAGNGLTSKVTAEAAKIHAIYRYPVKGLSPEPLSRTALAVNGTVPADRLYAIENGPSGFDPAAPSYFPKQRFLMLMRNERLARLRTRFDEKSHVLVVASEGREAARGDLRTADGRASIEQLFARFCA